jgi:crotonobetainyl-CoA:carnitine CoA-transferase CaiB-like acyl-CoA transferase
MRRPTRQEPALPTTACTALSHVWQLGGLAPRALEQVELTGADPILPSSFAVGTAAQASIAASTLAAAEVWRLRGGAPQAVRVDMRHAAVEFRSERHLRINGELPADPWDKIAGLYRCADGWVRLHTNFPHHRDGVLDILGCAYERAAVAAALSNWQAEEFERVASERRMVVAALRDFASWDAHPQGQALAGLPPITLERIGDAPAEPLTYAERPLGGIRVLDLTRVIAGPVCGRTLAAHGADVLAVSSPDLPNIESLVMDNGRGKRSCQLDLTGAEGCAALAALARDGDVFVQGYRPGGLADKGFGPEALAQLRPGIIYVSLSAYGHVGPWSGKRGFDSLVQTATGFNLAECQAAGESTPRVLPMQVLDHASGYLLAYGAMAALARRHTEGGSWHVRVSLAQTANWLRSLGRLENGFSCPELAHADIADLLETTDSGFGTMTSVRHAGLLTATPAHWALPSMPLGSHAAQWLAR